MLISQKLEAMTADYKDAGAVVGSFMLDADVLARAAALLARSERIAMLCISPNSILAELFQRKMMQIGVHIELIQQSEQGVFERYKHKVKYWMTFNEINALLISPGPGTRRSLFIGRTKTRRTSSSRPPTIS